MMMTYEVMREHMSSVPKDVYDALVRECQKNPWLCRGGIPFEDDFCLEMDSPYSFWATECKTALMAYFAHGNWAIRNGVVYHDLAFINQVNGGDEWWTLKRFGDTWTAFESITFVPMIRRGEFWGYIKRLESATLEQCKNLSY